LGYQQSQAEASVLAILAEGKSVKEGSGVLEVILDRTPFYAEGGGQLADHGQIMLDDGNVLDVFDVQSPLPGLFIHRGELNNGQLRVGGKVHAAIDNERRAAISRAHTATHMVHKAFREVLGETATQAGSENAPGRFRFDFPSTGPVSAMTMDEVEGRVNELLLANLPVSAAEMSQDEAKRIGAMALFGEKYGEIVRVVSVGDWAKELCGGTHVSASGELGLIKFLSESSIGSGVRRVEALVGIDAYSFLAREHLLLQRILDMVKATRTEEVPERIETILDSLKSAEKELTAVRIAKASTMLIEKLKSAPMIGATTVLIESLDGALTGDELRQVALQVRDRRENVVVVLTSVRDGKVILISATDEKARNSGAKAGALVKVGSQRLSGGGGGKDDFAQGGGSESSSIPSALAEIESELHRLLGK
jgi:alanyl-tRNA synthetase